jgi:hypothetical protein
MNKVLKLPIFLTLVSLLTSSCAATLGSVGSAGSIGPIGPAGPQGPTGPQGPAGPQGPTGPQGFQGASGSPGAAGAPGPSGSIGPRGKSAYEIYLEFYPGYNSLNNNNEQTWINDVAAGSLAKTLTVNIDNAEFVQQIDATLGASSVAKALVFSTIEQKIYVGQILNNLILNTKVYPTNSAAGWYTDSGLSAAIASEVVVNGNLTYYSKSDFPAANQTLIGTIEKPTFTGVAANAATLNTEITTMYTNNYNASTNVFDFKTPAVRSQYVTVWSQVPNAAAASVSNVVIPLQLNIPAGKTFNRNNGSASFVTNSAVVTDGTSLATFAFSPSSTRTDAVQLETNWGNKLILFANTNQAYSWDPTNYGAASDSLDGKVTYIYKVYWTDGTYTLYFYTVTDAD